MSVSGATPAGVDGRCPTEERVEQNLATWMASLRRATTAERRVELLTEMGLAIYPGIGDSDASDEPGDMSSSPYEVTLLGVADHPARLSMAARADHVLEVRYQLRRASETNVAHLIQVLRPIGREAWCLLGSDLSRRDDENHRLETYALDFVPLLRPETRAVQIDVRTTTLRRTQITRQYWIVDDLRLRKVFEQGIGGMSSDDGRTTTTQSGQVMLSGGIPRGIEIKEVTTETSCEASTEDAPCVASERAATRVFVYDGRSFSRRR